MGRIITCATVHLPFSPAGRSAERMRGDEGVFAANSEPVAPLIRHFVPPSPRWGEEGARRLSCETAYKREGFL
ncbi:hypothetical protein ASD31_18760 [Rhizobium sp. Root482]|nr:hypothetical protein ASD31_18760 [Rhizobium sp. Root482]